ncbi:hypothetical protein PMIT1327_00537 [Prochlorococcus marinus str. MIT 1327]|nr:hypothetical protein PMIT1327_00537 [Prochlorococcus marinus str. MIT 1327]
MTQEKIGGKMSLLMLIRLLSLNLQLLSQTMPCLKSIYIKLIQLAIIQQGSTLTG